MAELGFHCYVWAFSCYGERGLLQLRCTGFSLQWLLSLWSMGSRYAGFSSCGSQALECRLSSCGTWAYLLHGMWDLPGPGLEAVSPALVGGFLSTVPPGKPLDFILCYIFPKHPVLFLQIS